MISGAMIEPKNLRFVRAPDGAIGGVAKGLAQTFGFRTGAMRLAWVLSVLYLGLGLGLYVALWICLPRADRPADSYNRKLLGVCARLAAQLSFEPAIVRLVTIALTLLSLGSGVLAYVVLYFVLD